MLHSRSSRAGHTLAASVGALLLAVQPVIAQEQPTTVDEVVVTTETPEAKREIITSFVRATSVRTGTGQMGRWDKGICPVVEGLKSEYADFVLARISATAAEVGLEVGLPGCKPNLIVIATDNAEALLTQSVKKNRRAFLGDEWTIRLGSDKLKAFIEADQPVRWWFVVKRVTRDGTPYEEGSIIEGTGKIKSAVRADFSHVFVVLDVSRIRKVHYPALADYVAMVSLAQTSPNADLPNVPTILRLFSDRDAGLAPAEGLTDWDHAFLKALYAAKRDAKRMSVQEWEMSRSMEEALAADR